LSNVPLLVQIAKLLMERTNKTEKVPPIDPVEIAKCVAELQSKLMETKKTYVKMSSGVGALDEKILYQNLRKMTDAMKFKVEKKKTILKIPLGKEEYTYEFTW
jgi:hypothetical protein